MWACRSSRRPGHHTALWIVLERMTDSVLSRRSRQWIDKHQTDPRISPFHKSTRDSSPGVGATLLTRTVPSTMEPATAG